MPTYMITKYTKAEEINPGVTQAKAKPKPKQAYSCGVVVKLSSWAHSIRVIAAYS